MCAFSKDDVKLGVVGCGKMASAILGGVAKNKFMRADDIYVYDINMDSSGVLCREYGFREAYSLKELVKSTDVILLAVKPFVVGEILAELKEYIDEQLILSILAGVKIKKYTSVLKNSKVIRIMPNTPALVNEGMSAICADNKVTNDELDFAFSLMSNCGKVIKTTEDKIDIITALSGSGPAFYFKIIDLMAKSAAKLGLNPDEALLLSSQTALGSSKMIFENDFNIEQLIKNVTTPGGCTEVGNNVLLNSDIETVFDELIEKTMQKAIELG
ncbi:MAG: pyrroline-5-carboxylate reductase [Cyanobacteria bacterium SIG27]|nr:pyrroline-5-carboxylate reductase [Cyanobacteria bacterium SIG27]MBQ9150169.1 pyrroline-5-carboxylate reductase [bacterium]